MGLFSLNLFSSSSVSVAKSEDKDDLEECRVEPSLPLMKLFIVRLFCSWPSFGNRKPAVALSSSVSD